VGAARTRSASYAGRSREGATIIEVDHVVGERDRCRWPLVDHDRRPSQPLGGNRASQGVDDCRIGLPGVDQGKRLARPSRAAGRVDALRDDADPGPPRRVGQYRLRIVSAEYDPGEQAKRRREEPTAKRAWHSGRHRSILPLRPHGEAGALRASAGRSNAPRPALRRSPCVVRHAGRPGVAPYRRRRSEA